jgi:enoyl-CoA hydratase/carnithine racemase
MGIAITMTAAGLTVVLGIAWFGMGGQTPALPDSVRLPALVGPGRALEMMLTGRAVAVDEAVAMGLVNRVATADAPLREQAVAFGREVTRHAPSAIAAIRACVAAAGATVTDAGLAVEDTQVRANFDHPDAREGVAAFLEKREPHWGRG